MVAIGCCATLIFVIANSVATDAHYIFEVENVTQIVDALWIQTQIISNGDDKQCNKLYIIWNQRLIHLHPLRKTAGLRLMLMYSWQAIVKPQAKHNL